MSAEQLPYDRLADDAHLAGVADVMLGERFALVHIGPVAHLQKRGVVP